MPWYRRLAWSFYPRILVLGMGMFQAGVAFLAWLATYCTAAQIMLKPSCGAQHAVQYVPRRHAGLALHYITDCDYRVHGVAAAVPSLTVPRARGVLCGKTRVGLCGARGRGVACRRGCSRRRSSCWPRCCSCLPFILVGAVDCSAPGSRLDSRLSSFVNQVTPYTLYGPGHTSCSIPGQEHRIFGFRRETR